MMKIYYIGDVDPNDLNDNEIKKDFEALRQRFIDKDLFNPNKLFYFGLLSHVILFELLAWILLYNNPLSILSIFGAVVFLTISQTQGAWLQHDFGHFSAAKTVSWNQRLQYLVMGFIKGVPVGWWNHLHNMHHTKTNIINVDPDASLHPLFVIGEKTARTVGKSKEKSFLPYDLQHFYFPLIFPPLLFPIFFQLMHFRHLKNHGTLKEFVTIGAFLFRWMAMYGLIFNSVLKPILLFFLVRTLESIWFTWVSQSNHIPMRVDDEFGKEWLDHQLSATCNLEPSTFNNWFTGHLNFQIEHHLFPTMPRHNYQIIAPYVKDLCAKHNLVYQVKPMHTAFLDILRALYKSGQLWKAVYQANYIE